MWSNSCCGHPAPDEDNVSAAYRRLDVELGLTPIALEEVSQYRYCFSHLDVMENEICPILVGFVDAEPALNSDEVEAVRWVDWQEFIEEVKSFPKRYSEWCVEETLILEKNVRLQELLKTYITHEKYKNNIYFVWDLNNRFDIHRANNLDLRRKRNHFRISRCKKFS